MSEGADLTMADLTMANLTQMSEEVRSPAGPAAGTRVFNEALITEFRQNSGVLSGELSRARFLLLTTTGAKSGRVRTTPLAYIRVDGRILIIASMGGAPSSPAWYHNLVAHPEVNVEIGAEAYRAQAVVTQGEDRNALFGQVCAKLPVFAEYQTRTPRMIPVVELRRLAAPS